MPNTARRLLARLLSRLIGCRAFSSEVETGSRQENASNQESRAPFRFYRNGKGTSDTGFEIAGVTGVDADASRGATACANRRILRCAIAYRGMTGVALMATSAFTP